MGGEGHGHRVSAVRIPVVRRGVAVHVEEGQDLDVTGREVRDQHRRRGVRLTDLPYGPVKKQPTPKPKPLPKPKPGQPPKIIKAPPVPAPQRKPGVITDMKQNQIEAARVMAAWHRFAGGTKTIAAAGAFRFTDDLVREGRKVGTQDLLVSADGRLRLAYTLDGQSHLLGYDGKNYWAGPKEETPGVMKAEDALDDPFLMAAMALATSLREKGLASFAAHELTGADRAQGRRAYRLRASDKEKNDLNLWISMYGESGEPESRLTKAAGGFEGDADDTAVVFGRYREVAGVMLPHRRKLVSGAGEQVELQMVTDKCEAVASPAKDAFGSPKDAE